MTVRLTDRSFEDVAREVEPYAAKGGAMIYVGLIVVFLILLGVLMMVRRNRSA
jgi:hypothetical protein